MPIRPATTSLRVVALLIWSATCLASSASAQTPAAPASAAPALRCAVEGEAEIMPSGKLCETLGAALGRVVVRVPDARENARGDAIQILAGDVEWIVALLRNGQVRAWTRISKTYAQGKEVATITRVSRALLAQKLRKNERCVRVEPNGGRRMRGFDLAYPWVELKECAARFTEVPDPWWNET